jgi:hypothetical protein
MTKSLFEIKFVEHEANFYQTGSLHYYELRCERFNYSSEKLDTGISEIDSIDTNYSEANGVVTDQEDYTITTQNGNPLDIEPIKIIDPTTQNEYFANASIDFVDFSDTNPFSDLVV